MNEMDLGLSGGSGADKQLNWRAAYAQYKMDMKKQGLPALPMAQFVERMMEEMRGQPSKGENMGGEMLGESSMMDQMPGRSVGLLGR